MRLYMTSIIKLIELLYVPGPCGNFTYLKKN